MATQNIKKVRTNDSELKERVVKVNRVTKVTKGGRTFTFAAIVVVGNENGIVGYGLGKANEVATAVSKGVEDAKKNLIKVPVYKGTIPHAQIAKFGGADYLGVATFQRSQPFRRIWRSLLQQPCFAQPLWRDGTVWTSHRWRHNLLQPD